MTALLIARTNRVFLWMVALWFSSTLLYLPSRVDRIIYIVIVFSFWFQVGLWGMAAVRYAIERRGRRAGAASATPVQSGSIDIIVFIAGLTIWTMAFLLALDNLGVQIKPLLTGLGIGGVAVALAVQSVLGDVLASMSIALDKPFGIGDSLVVDDVQGTVEHIGVKSTRLRSISGEQIILSNADVLKARVRNYGRMRERRSAFRLNVTYDTPPEKLREIPPAVRAVIEAQPQTRFDRCHFLAFGDWALQFEVVLLRDGVGLQDLCRSAADDQSWNPRALRRARRRPRLREPFAAHTPAAAEEAAFGDLGLPRGLRHLS